MTAIYSIGFAPKSPNTDEIRNGLFQDPALSSGAPALVLWAEVFWVEAGDRVRLRITGPNGEAVIDSKNVSPKRQARRLIFAGRKKRGLFWPGGNYHGEIVIERRDASGQTQRFTASRHVELKGLRERHE